MLAGLKNKQNHLEQGNTHAQAQLSSKLENSAQVQLVY